MLAITLVLLASLATSAGWRKWNRKDTPDTFATMCVLLFNHLPVKGEDKVNATREEYEVLFPKQINLAHLISAKSKDLSPIAKAYAQDLEKFYTIAKKDVDPSELVFGLLNAALGVYTGQRKLIAEGGQKTLNESKLLWNRYQDLQHFFRQRRIHAIELMELAPRFSGPVTNAPLAAWSFTHRTPSFFDFFTLDRWYFTITNSAGTDLHNCILVVRFSNEDGEAILHHYFVPKWAKGEIRIAEYSAADYPESIVSNVSRVEVIIWTKEWSSGKDVLKKPLFGWRSSD